mgnify:CR=1 FL=1
MPNNQKHIIIQPDGTAINLRDLQKISLEILDYFDAFCNANNLKYTLCGGACIGALRHEGFIPWDDDIDIHMFRDDYERLFTLWKNYPHTKNYNFIRTTKDKFCDTMLTQISDIKTTFIKSNQTHLNIDHGVKLEIIPLDGAPEGKVKRNIQLFWALIFYLFNRGFAPKNRGKFAEIIGDILLKLIKSQKSRSKIWTFAQQKMTKYKIENSSHLTELCVTWKYMKLRYPKEIFEGERRVSFEGRMLPIPMKAEEYLETAFGNYLELPPLEEQVPKHETAYIDLNNSYKKYKGTYYCK